MRIMAAVLAGTVAVAFGAAEAAPRGRKAPAITNPDWLARPTGEDVARHYPELAQMLDLEGRATVSCAVDDLGQLQGCEAISEWPKGLGFGEAAIGMSRLFRMRPMTRDGQAVSGGTVRIPITFRLPAAPKPEVAEPAPAAAPDRLTLARQIAGELRIGEKMRAEMEREVARLEARSLRYSDIISQTAAAEALRGAMARHAIDFDQPAVDFLAREYSVAELTEVLAFMRGPGGQALARQDPNEMRPAQREYLRVAGLRAQEAFCGRWLCKPDVRRTGLEADIDGPRPKVTIPLPEWQRQPSGLQLRTATPQMANILGLAGLVRMTCQVTALGGLEACGVASEQPVNLGFGAAAVKLAPAYIISRQLLSQGAAGETTSVLVYFPARSDIPEALPPRTRSPKAVDLAVKVLAATGNGETMRVYWRSFANSVVTETPGLSDEARAAMGEILRDVQQPASVAMLAVSAAQLVAMFTDAELAAQAAFFATPVGQRWGQGEVRAMEASGEAYARIHQAVVRDAQATFCADRDCGKAEP